MVTYLAIAFVIALVFLVLYGFGFVMRRPSDGFGPESARCTLCRQVFEKSDLIERQVGDSRLLFFCESCIGSLQKDVESRRSQPTSTVS